jgi:predicted metal-dependent hydrolase
VSGETHLYLGKQYRLKVEAAPGQGIKLSRGRFFIATPEPANTAAIKAQLDAWYRAKAEIVFAQQLAACLQRVAVVGITAMPDLRIRTMQKRWGSCTEAGVITLNLKLIQAPKLLIDYVIIHELCHLKEHNHSAAYYRLLDRTLPQWRERREALNQVKVA